MRELEHLLGRSVLKALGRQPQRPRILNLLAEDLDLPGSQGQPAASVGEAASAAEPLGRMSDAVAKLQRELVTSALVMHGHNWAAAARVLGMDRANLARLAKRLGLAVGRGA